MIRGIIMFIVALLLLLISFLLSFLIFYLFIKKLILAKRFGIDMNKPGNIKVPEPGGIAAIISFLLLMFSIIFLQKFNYINLHISNESIIIISFVATIIAFIGLVDDMISLPQITKAFLPMIGAVPIIATKFASSTIIYIPIIGPINFGIFYFILLVPLFITVASNLTNMLAGFNGIEYGMVIPLYLGSLLFGFLLGNNVLIITSSIMLGIAFAGFYFSFSNKMFPGDVGTLMLGGIMSAQLIVSNFESYHLVFFIYVLDFIIKALNGFPSKNWWGVYKNGKLYAPKKPVGLIQYVMKMTNGIEEKKLTLLFIGLQFIVVLLFFIFYNVRI